MKRLIVALVATGMALAACGGGGAPAAKLGVFYDMLRVIPDLPENRHKVYINDYARIRQLFSISLPEAEVTDEELRQYFSQLAGGPADPARVSAGPFLSGLDRFAERSPIRRANVGFGPQDVDQSILAGEPPREFEAVKGRFDPQATQRAIAGCTDCPPATLETYKGATIYDWGVHPLQVDRGAIFARPAFDHLGRIRPLAVQRELAFRAPGLPFIRLMIALNEGEKPSLPGRQASLADVEEFRLLAKGLSDLGVYAALLTDRTQQLSDDQARLLGEERSPQEQERLRQALAQPGLLRPYQAFATGRGDDDRGPYMALVLVHATDQAAQANVALLRQRIETGSSLRSGQPWNELVSSIETRVEGRVLLAKLHGSLTRSGTIWLVSSDGLILHE